jgi:hypothetical protein
MAMSSTRQDQNIGNAVVDLVLEYCEIDDLYTDEEIIEYVRAYISLTDAFEESTLDDWALDQGYTKD